MSVVFVVVPAAAASWPILCTTVAAAAAALGYRTLQTSQVDARAEAGETSIDLEAGKIVVDAMRIDQTFSVAKDDVTATFRRTADGRATVHVSGQNRSTAELEAIGQELMGRVTQQFAYNKVMTELKSQGFNVTSEDVAQDQTIRVRVSRYV